MASFKKSLSPRVVLIFGSLALGVLIASELTRSGAPSEWTPMGSREPARLESPLKTLDGEPVGRDSLEGTVVLVNFWATWCGPCIAEMPSLARLHERFRDQGLRILAVSEEPAETIRRFLETRSYPFDMVRDPGGDLALEVGVVVLPSTLLIDRHSRLVVAHQGAEEWDRPELLKQFEELLAEP